MSRRSSLTAVAVLAASGALVAGCSSSSSSSSSTPTAASTSAPAPATSASGTASSTGASSASSPSAADCVIISKISSGVVSTLTPLASEPTSKAAPVLKAYLAKLTADEAQLTSAGGKAALGSFITALEKSENESESAAEGALTTAIGNLASACS
jgi:hypothetical protein